MNEETTNTETPEKAKGQPPAGKYGKSAAWLKTISPKDPSKKPYDLFEISSGSKGGPKEYGSIFASAAGHNLTGTEACKLYEGDCIEVELAGSKGKFPAVLFPAERDVRLSGDQNQYKTTSVKVGCALYRTAKPTAERPTPEPFGFQIPDPSEFVKDAAKKAPVNFYLTARCGVQGENGGPMKEVELDPAQMYRLLKGETVELPEVGVKGATAKLGAIKVKGDGDKYRDASVYCRFNDLNAEIAAWEEGTGEKFVPKQKAPAPAQEAKSTASVLPEEDEVSEESAVRA